MSDANARLWRKARRLAALLLVTTDPTAIDWEESIVEGDVAASMLLDGARS